MGASQMGHSGLQRVLLQGADCKGRRGVFVRKQGLHFLQHQGLPFPLSLSLSLFISPPSHPAPPQLPALTQAIGSGPPRMPGCRNLRAPLTPDLWAFLMGGTFRLLQASSACEQHSQGQDTTRFNSREGVCGETGPVLLSLLHVPKCVPGTPLTAGC